METTTTFAGFAIEWLEGQRLRLQPSTWHGYAGVVRLYLRPALGDLALDGVTSGHLNRLYSHLMGGGGKRFGALAPRSVRQVHAVASRIFDSALLQGFIQVNPAWAASPPRPYGGEPRPLMAVWTAAEAREFLRITERHSLGVLFYVAVMTGLRRGELLALRWDHVSEDGSILVTASLTETDGEFSLHVPKIRRPRRITLDPDTGLRLERHRLWEALKPRSATPSTARWNFVFTDDAGEVVRPDRVSYEFRKIVRHSDLPRIRFHDLRHTHATLLLTAGVPMHVVAARLGHSSRTLLAHYAHLLPSADTAAALLIADLLNGCATNGPTAQVSAWAEPGMSPDAEMWQWNKRSGAKAASAALASSAGRMAAGYRARHRS